MKKPDMIKKIKNFKNSELEVETAKAKSELKLLYLEVRAGKVDNYSKVSAKRKEIARMLTIKAKKIGETRGK